MERTERTITLDDLANEVLSQNLIEAVNHSYVTTSNEESMKITGGTRSIELKLSMPSINALIRTMVVVVVILPTLTASIVSLVSIIVILRALGIF